MTSNIWYTFIYKIKNDFPNIYIWLENANGYYDKNDNKFIIEVPDAFHKKTLDEKYKYELISILREILNNDEFSLVINVKPEPLFQTKKNNIPKITIKEKQITLPLETKINYIPNLNTAFKFDNFIVGNSNKFTHAACKAVAESPGQTYNPLFIYGGVGLGKTHLLHAIGNFVYEHNPSMRIIITTAEMFLSEVVRHINEKRMDEFKEKYRNVDLLLVDDIQYLKGESTTEEFFHTFNELHLRNKQIVATSDSPPSELKLEERLKSRFSSGIIADIQPPDFELRVAILKQKAKEINRVIPDNIIAYIAEYVDTNVRALGSTFKTLISLSDLNNVEISMELAKQAVKMTNPVKEFSKKISIDMIQQVVAEYFNIKVQDLSSKKRPENIALARQFAMYITRSLTDYSLVQIGQYFGGKDHTTVMHAIDKIEKLIEKNENYKVLLNELIARIQK
ncbi:MAG: chromosomal replication initiator protein DnaA [Candidatus Goldbacteria bacterium]|nr:chromosomal replication initiator protein DnaA [Candidatus Goldiibacteriota bacterium]